MTAPYHVTVSPSLADWPDWPAMAGMNGLGGYCFQGRDFLEVWLATVGAARGTTPAFVRVEDGAGRTLMWMPLGVERRSGLRTLIFLDGGVVDYNAPILAEGAGNITGSEMAEIWAEMVRKLPAFDLTVLEKMPGEVSATRNPLADIGAGPDRRSGHVLSLEGTWEAYAARRLPRRQDSRRKRRQLAEIGPLRLAVASSDAEAAHFLSEMVRQKTRRYMETHGEDQFERPGYRTYFPAMTERFRTEGIVQIAAVYVGDAIIATHWGIVTGGRFHYLMPTFEGDDWRRFSPGRLLIEELIAWSYANGLHTFDFGPGDESFKDEFGDKLVPLLRVERPGSLIGSVQQTMVRTRRAVAAGRAGPFLKDARDRLRSMIRKR